MGRRPNAVVFEYFERGRKLEDSSNRYEHTCKRCREVFPKGRVDSLIGHVLRRCPVVTQHDRDLVKSQIKYDAALRGQTRNSTRSLKNFRSGVLTSHTQLLSLPEQEQLQHQSALDTLAEVSRQQLDYSSQRPSWSPGTGQHQQARAHDLVEQTLLAHLGSTVANDNSTDGLSAFLPMQVASSTRDDFDVAASAGGLATSPLVQAASAANKQLEKVHNQQLETPKIHSDLLDPRLDKDDSLVTPGNSVAAVTTIDNDSVWQEHDRVDTGGCNPDSMIFTEANDTTTRYGLFATTPGKTRARNKFTDSRRKEVQEIRKRGACLRCRMLKKSCSEGTPCETCARVESARLWKGKCLRTRVADEFVLWSTSLFQIRASIQTSAALYDYDQEPRPGNLKVQFLSASTACVTFACNEHKRTAGAPIGNVGDDALYLLQDGEAISAKIHDYVQQISDAIIMEETDSFLRATLQEAQRLAVQEETNARSTDVNLTGRSCYSLQDDLVGNTIGLWIETRLLTLSHSMLLQMEYTAVTEPAQAVDQVSWQENASICNDTKTISPSSDSGKLIQIQILAAIESRCARLSQSILHDIERRLLQRQQVNGFATFISAVLLLNCVERMTGLYRSFDNCPIPGEDDKPSADHVDDKLVMPSDWPLDTHPQKLWTQGRHFAELLIMLLRMRALPPATVCTEDGYVVARQDSAVSISRSRGSTHDTSDDQASDVAAWLDPIQLRAEDLLAKEQGPEAKLDEGIRCWDMKFISGLLRPVMTNG